MRRFLVILGMATILGAQVAAAQAVQSQEFIVRDTTKPFVPTVSSEPTHFIGRWDIPSLPLPAKDTFATYAYTYGDIVIFSYGDSNECELIDAQGNKVWTGILMQDEYHLEKNLYADVYMIQASKEFTVLSGDPFTTGIGNWTAVDQTSSPLSTKLLNVGPARGGSRGAIPALSVFAYYDNTQVIIRNLDTQDTIWEGVLDSAKYYVKEMGDYPPMFYSVEATKPVMTITGGGLGGKYIPSYNGTFTGRDFITYQQVWTTDPTYPLGHDFQIIPWEDNTTVWIVDLDNQADTIWKEHFAKKGDVKGKFIYNGTEGKALYIHSDKDISISENPWISWSPSTYIGFFLIRSIDRDGLGIGKEFYQPLEGSVSWSSPPVLSRLHVVAYSDSTNVKVTQIPKYGGGETTVWQGRLHRGEYYRYTCPIDDPNAWAVYHVVASKGVSVIGNCRDLEGSDFLPLWFAIHPAVAATPSPQFKETECLVAARYEVYVENNGNKWDVINMRTNNSMAPDFVTALSDSLGGTMPDVDGNGQPDTDTLAKGGSFLVLADVTPSDTMPFGTIDTCYLRVISREDTTKQDTALLITYIREVDIVVDPDTVVFAYPGDNPAIPVRALNTSLYREDTVNLTWTSTRSTAGWPIRVTELTGSDIVDSDGDGVPDVAGVQPNNEPYGFQVRVGIPDSAVAGSRDTIYVVGTSSNYPLRLYSEVVDTAVVIVEVEPVPGLVVRPDTMDSTFSGVPIIYPLEVLNFGNGPDVPDIRYTAGQASWAHRLVATDMVSNLTDTDGDGTPDVGTVPGISAAVPGLDTFYLEVTPPYSALSGLRDSTVVYAYSSVDNTVYDSAIVVTVTRSRILLDIEPDTTATIIPGEEAVYYLRVTNLGGAADTVDIGSYALPEIGWTYAIYDSLTGNALVDNDASGFIDVGEVDSLETRTVRFVVRPPAELGELLGQFDTTVIETRYVWIRTHYTNDTTYIDDSVEVVTVFEPKFDIHNYPNPFSGRTTFAYSIPSAGNVTLRVYNRAGEHVRTLIDNEHVERGGLYEISWDGLTTEGRRPAPGVYLYSLEWRGDAAKGLVKTRRIVKKALLEP